MRKRNYKSVISMVLTAAMVAGLMSPINALAETETTETPYDPFVVSAEKADGVMNLTELGTMDWVHVNGERVERKAGGSGDIVIDTDTDVSLSDSPVVFSWSDAESDTEKLFRLNEISATPSNALATDSNAVKATDSNAYRATDSNAVNPLERKALKSQTKAVTHDTRTGGVFKEGYEFSVKPADTVRCLTFITGVWQAASELNFASYDDRDAESGPLYRYTSVAGQSAEVRKVHVLLRAGEGVTVSCKIFGKKVGDGNASLSGLVLYELDMAEGKDPIQVLDAPDSMNLTKEGTLDWVHPEGSKNTTSRKANVDELIAVERGNEDSIDNAGDAKVSLRWTDGTPVESDSGNKSAAVYTYKPGDGNYVDKEITDDSGYKIILPKAETNEILQFISGAWNSEMAVTLNVNGTEKAVYYGWKAGGDSNTRLFSIPVLAGEQVTVEVSYVKKTHGYGNVSLSAVLLKKDEDKDSYKNELGKLIQTAEELDCNLYLDWTVDMLRNELARARELMEAGHSEEYEYYCEYRFLQAALESLNLMGKTYFVYETNSGLTSSFGWEGDINAPIAYIDGSYKLRSRDNIMVNFGVPGITEKIKWYNAEGYLPCFVSEFTKAEMDYKIENFADCVEIDGSDFEVAYSRMTAVNLSGSEMVLPRVSNELIPLNQEAESAAVIAAGETIVRDYAICADRFGTSNEWPDEEQLKAAGDYDLHYSHMKDYWNDRLKPLAEITELPDESLINAYKAGYIYTLIIRDDIPQQDGSVKRSLHVGENGYDEMFDHDTIGIVSTLLTMGDYTYAKDYLSTLPAQLQYDDAKWKYSWPYALYLQRTGDTEFIRENFDVIRENTHKVESDRDMGAGGIMKRTNAIDSYGYWTTDNWSAMTGLTTYRYICEQLGEEEEAKWAGREYKELLECVNQVMEKTMADNGISYIPMSMVERNEDGPRSDPRDGNWASMFLFGRWGWDGYLFGAEQSGVMVDQIDDTYAAGFERRAELTDNPYNFGGYPHGYFSSAYNAGYGSTALRGEKYRDAGIKAYQFMIQKSMSGPFGWWEGVAYPEESSPWNLDHAAGGGGSCQHMWGQSTATKVLFDSLLAAKADNSVIVGRGIPKEWIAEDENDIEIQNYPVYNGKRMGYRITTQGTEVTIEFTGNEEIAASIELPVFKNNIKSAGEFRFDNETGCVKVPAGTNQMVIELYMDGKGNAEEEADKTALIKVIEEAQKLSEEDYTAESWSVLEEALANALDCAQENGSQADIDAAVLALNHAMTALMEKEQPDEVADKTELKKSIEEAKKLAEEDYTAESWLPFKKAFAQALSYVNQEIVSQNDINAAVHTLNSAMSGLVRKEQSETDKTGLEALVKQAQNYSQRSYTARSWAVLEKALADALEVLNNAAVTEDEVKESAERLQNAILALARKSSSEGSQTGSTTGQSENGQWLKDEKGWWIKNPDGSYPSSSWKQVGGVWYYFDQEGYMTSEWNLVDGKWYYMNRENGGMHTGWLQDSTKGYWYYLDVSAGEMKTGWQQIDREWYYFNEMETGDLPFGAALINTVTPDGYRVDENGRRIHS